MVKTQEEIVMITSMFREAIADSFANDFERASRFILIPDYIIEGVITGERKLWHRNDIRKVEEFIDKYNKMKESK